MGWLDLAKKIHAALKNPPEPWGSTFSEPIPKGRAIGSLGWALAMVFSLWTVKKDKSEDVSSIVGDPSLRLAELISQLDSFASALPKSLQKGIESASAADDVNDARIEGAAVYFNDALSSPPGFVISGIMKWLRGRQFVDVANALVLRYPALSPTVQVTARIARTPAPSRSDRFDRERPAPTPVASRPALSPRPTEAVLTDEELARANLLALGWEPHAVETFHQGPESATKTGVQVFRRYRGLPKAEQAALRDGLKKKNLLAAPKPDPTVNALLASSPELLEGQAGYLTSLDAYKDYSGLAAHEKSVFIGLLANEGEA